MFFWEKVQNEKMKKNLPIHRRVREMSKLPDRYWGSGEI